MPNQVTYSFIASDKFSAVARRIRRSADGIKRKFKEVSKETKDLRKSLTSLGQGAQRMSLAAGAGVAASLKSFGDLEQGVKNVLTLLDDDAAVKKYRGQIQGLAEDAVKAGFSIQDSTKGLFDNVSALGANERSFVAFNTSQKLAIAGVTDLSVAVKGVTSLMAAYKGEIERADDVANAFFSAQKKGQTTVAALAMNVGKVAPIAKTAGIGFKELLATLSQLTLGGLSTEEASTALRAAINSLLKPSKDAEKILRALGVPVGATQIRAAGLGQTLAKLAVVGERFPDLLSQAIPNIRAFTAAASLGEKELANIDNTMNLINRDIADGTGLNKAYADQLKAFNQEMARTFGAVKILAAEIGGALAPAFRVLGTVLRIVAIGFSKMHPAVKTVVATVLSIVALAAPVLLFFGKFLVVVKAVGAGIAAAFGAVSLPILLILGGISFAIVTVVKNWKALKREFSDPVQGLKDFGSFLKTKAANLVGLGGGDEVDVTGNVSTKNQSNLDVNMNINAPKGVVGSVKSKTSGAMSGLKLGVNMQEAL